MWSALAELLARLITALWPRRTPEGDAAASARISRQTDRTIEKDLEHVDDETAVGLDRLRDARGLRGRRDVLQECIDAANRSDDRVR